MQEFLILILQLSFTNFCFFSMCHCTVFRLHNLSHTIIFGGPNKQSQQSSVKMVLYFGAVLKQRQSATNKALTLICFPALICFVPINLLFWTVVLSSLITMAHKNLKNMKMVTVKSKLKFLAFRPEVQQTDMTSVYETFQNSKMLYVLTCHSPRMHFC